MALPVRMRHGLLLENGFGYIPNREHRTAVELHTTGDNVRVAKVNPMRDSHKLPGLSVRNASLYNNSSASRDLHSSFVRVLSDLLSLIVLFPTQIIHPFQSIVVHIPVSSNLNLHFHKSKSKLD